MRPHLLSTLKEVLGEHLCIQVCINLGSPTYKSRLPSNLSDASQNKLCLAHECHHIRAGVKKLVGRLSNVAKQCWEPYRVPHEETVAAFSFAQQALILTPLCTNTRRRTTTRSALSIQLLTRNGGT